jgi:hypothetical protein
MARRPRGEDDDVSLFPFLSIIACVIGVLTMMISTLALAQMDNPDVALIEAYEKSAGELSAVEAEVARLKKLLDDKIGPGAATVREAVSERSTSSLPSSKRSRSSSRSLIPLSGKASHRCRRS